MGPRFVILDGSLAGQVFSLEGGRKTFGRGPMNDVDIPDMQVSQRHCLLQSRNEQFAVVDLGSLNGTFVNKVRIDKETLLKDGDEVRMGSTRLMFCTEEGMPQLPDRPAGFLQNVELIPQNPRSTDHAFRSCGGYASNGA